jgi:hypothetical protein
VCGGGILEGRRTAISVHQPTLNFHLPPFNWYGYLTVAIVEVLHQGVLRRISDTNSHCIRLVSFPARQTGNRGCIFDT